MKEPKDYTEEDIKEQEEDIKRTLKEGCPELKIANKYNIFEPWKTLDPWQKKYIETEGNCFLLCGRQSGKSAAASIKFGKRAATHPQRKIYMLAYTEKQAYNLFFKTLTYIKSVYPKTLITKGAKKPTKHIINLKNHSQIFCYAVGLTGEGIRGPTATDLVVDEAAPMANEVFDAITPMLSITKGNFDILSTPRGKKNKNNEDTYFYKCSKNDIFTKFYVSAEDCPRHSKEFLKNERASMGELVYAQEYLAMFLDDLKRVFSDEQIKELCILKRRENILKDRDYFIGCDVGRIKDPFTYEILDRTNREKIEQVENLTIKNTPIPECSRKIMVFNELYNFRKEYIDSGGMGITVCDILREDDENKRKVVEINNASRRYMEDGKERKKGILKEDLYKNLMGLMDQRKIYFLDDDEIKLSFASIQMEFKEGKTVFFGNNAHIVEGLTRAAWCSKDKTLNIYIY